MSKELELTKHEEFIIKKARAAEKRELMLSRKELLKQSKNAPNDTFMVIDGENVTYRKFHAFISYMESGGSIKEACKATGYKPESLYKLKARTWWHELTREWYEPYLEKFFTNMGNRVDDMDRAAGEILDGTYSQPAMANAALGIMRLFAKIGMKRGESVTAPLEHTITPLWHKEEDQEQNVTVNLNFNIVKDLTKEMTKDESLNWAMSGQLPERLAHKAKELTLEIEEKKKREHDEGIIDVEDLNQEK